MFKSVFFPFFILVFFAMPSDSLAGEAQQESNKVEEAVVDTLPVDLSDETLSDDMEETDPSLEEPTSTTEAGAGFDPGTPPITTESLEEEDQIEVLGALIDRILGEDDPETSLDLPICQTPHGTLTTSGFPFGDIIYNKGSALIVYHIALAEEEGDEIYEDEAEEEE